MKWTVLRLVFLGLVMSIVHTLANDDGTRSKDLVPIERNGKWGYADQSGHIVIRPAVHWRKTFSEGLALVWTGGAPLTDPVVTSFVKMGYINPTGHWVIHSRYKYYFYENYQGDLYLSGGNAGKRVLHGSDRQHTDTTAL